MISLTPHIAPPLCSLRLSTKTQQAPDQLQQYVLLKFSQANKLQGQLKRVCFNRVFQSLKSLENAYFL